MGDYWDCQVRRFWKKSGLKSYGTFKIQTGMHLIHSMPDITFVKKKERLLH